jgi:acetoin utilization deacetylase AcuC-like enzyme
MMALVHSKDYEAHETGQHPENKERIRVIMDNLERYGILNRVHGQNYRNPSGLNKVDVYEPEIASREDILRVHTASYVDQLKSFCNGGGGYLDYDTVVSKESYKIAKLSAGGSITATKLVLNGYNSAYSIARPPGHHATKERAMGFCLFNNLAIAIEHLKKHSTMKKFMVFDFDVHYGNGDAEIFKKDPNVFYISIHQDPKTIFPGSGYIEEIGEDDGKGYNMNIPMPPGSSTQEYKYIIEELLEPLAQNFDADFYFLEVGFDAHQDDPLSRINLDDEFYPWITSKMSKIASKLVLILEGGYNFEVLSRCNMKMINVLMNTNDDGEEIYQTPINKNYVSEGTQKILKNIQDVFSSFYEL